MAMSRELPHDFSDALKIAKSLLSQSEMLVKRNLIDTEAEQIVIAAFKFAEPQSTPFTRINLYARLKDRMPAKAAEKVLMWSMARAEGKPLQHLIGAQVFLEHEYEVGPDVLIPRPETEILVTEVIQFLDSCPEKPTLGFEVGLGSGVISIELLSRYSDLKMLASELSEKAIEQARKNAKRILGKVDRLTTIVVPEKTEILSVFPELKADFIVSNPPYLVRKDEVDEGVAEHEPEAALFAPEGDPLFYYREILAHAAHYLKPLGLVFMEVPHERALEILLLVDEKLWEKKLVRDLTQRDRVLIARLRA